MQLDTTHQDLIELTLQDIPLILRFNFFSALLSERKDPAITENNSWLTMASCSIGLVLQIY